MRGVGRAMAVRAHLLVLEIHFATIRAFGYLSRNLHTAARTNGCFVANLMSALRTFYTCHKMNF